MFSRALYACGILYLNFVSPAVGSTQPDPKSKNHYEVLKLQRNCTVTQIKKAYRQLALELHPDKVRLSTRFGDLDMEMAKTMFLEVQNAYSVLAIPGACVLGSWFLTSTSAVGSIYALLPSAHALTFPSTISLFRDHTRRPP
jgi:hypothetical protein